jgi:integral membrane sensor domain MASE1
MFAAIAFAGSLGGLIGYSLVAATCPDSPTRAEQMLQQIRGFQAHVPSCALKELAAALVGTIVAAIGAATVAVLVMRAQSEWRGHAPRPRS